MKKMVALGARGESSGARGGLVTDACEMRSDMTRYGPGPEGGGSSLARDAGGAMRGSLLPVTHPSSRPHHPRPHHSRNDLGPAGGTAIGEALASVTALTSLDVGCAPLAPLPAARPPPGPDARTRVRQSAAISRGGGVGPSAV